MRLLSTPLLAAAVLLAPAGWLHAAVRVAHIFGTHMVLQRGMHDPIWGRAHPGQSVTIAFDGQRVTTQANAAGRWMATLAPMHASSHPQVMTISGGHTHIRFSDVLIGDVWLCSGQSNMQFPVDGWWAHVLHARREVAAAHNSHIALLKIPRANSPGDQRDFNATWMRCTPTHIKRFSAVAWFFGRDLYRRLHVPIGVIDSSYGGTVIQSWTPMSVLRRTPALHGDVVWFKKAAQRYHRQLIAYQSALHRWQQAARQARSLGRPIPHRPDIHPPQNPYTLSRPSPDMAPASIFHSMIFPLIPLAIRGVVWYQGENNAWVNDPIYAARLAAMIRGWRARWHQPSMPFLLVQIAPCMHYPKPTVGEPIVWQAEQAAVRNLPQTGLIGTADFADLHNIHFPDKQGVGRRLCSLALHMVYHHGRMRTLGPMFKSAQIHSNYVTIQFSDVYHGLKTRHGQAPNWFQIAGSNRQYLPARARIVGKTVRVWSSRVPHPVAVRFGWNSAAIPNLIDGRGDPVLPFRTDHWPLK